MIKLNVCLDHVAAIRRLMDRNEPDPLASAVLSQLHGAEGVTASWLPDHPGFEAHEFPLLRQLVHTHLNLVITPAEDAVQNALALHPDMVTLVPTGYKGVGLNNEWVHAGWPESDTTNRPVASTVEVLQSNRILVNMLIRPSASDVRMCAQLKTDYVHIDASSYTTAGDATHEQHVLDELSSTAKMAARLHIGVSMGRGITYGALPDIAGIREVEEVVVGHAVMARALQIGFDRAVRNAIDLIRHAPRGFEA